MKKYTIDANGKKMGRVASDAAAMLMGKREADFDRSKLADVHVTIINVAKASISDKKKDEKTYFRHSQYPGGDKLEKMSKVISEKGHKEVFKKAVYGMLPPNKLRPKIMKNLIITE